MEKELKRYEIKGHHVDVNSDLNGQFVYFDEAQSIISEQKADIERLRKAGDELAKNIINYVENEAEIAMPIEEMFNENREHITKKQYGLVLLKYLCEELRSKYLTKKEVNNG